MTGLGLRVTPAGKPSYIFQGDFMGRTLCVTIGSPDAWSIPQAQEKARALQRLIGEVRDPREVKGATKAGVRFDPAKAAPGGLRVVAG